MNKANRFATLGLVLGSFVFAAGAQAQEEEMPPSPTDDMSAPLADERTEETLPAPEDSLQPAEPTGEQIMQDAEQPEPPLAEGVTTAANDSDTADTPAGSLSSPEVLQQALETRFQSGDENGDGRLSESEIAALDDDDLVFADIDGDGDGAVSREEWGMQLQAQVASADNDMDD
jgi:ABC-type uncharacterized transport system involved in gliding motility auxiliary subunit